MDNILINKAIERFGLTDDCGLAGYILPDGSLLDLSEEFVQGRIEHAAIKNIFDDEFWLRNQEHIARFLTTTGSIRLHHMSNSTFVELSDSHEPSFEQMQAIRTCACEQGLEPHRIIYDLVDKKGRTTDTGEFFDGFRDTKCKHIFNKFMNGLIKKYGGEL